MRLDFSSPWSLVCIRAAEEPEGPAAFALAELSSILTRMGAAQPVIGDEDREENLLILDAGRAASRGAAPGGRRRSPRFSWRASESRVEIYGEDPGALLVGVYDFLRALGARWPAPGSDGERLPRGPVFELETASRASYDDAVPATLILGHGCYVEDWRDQLEWAPRAGYSSVFFHVTPEAFALGAAPTSLYEAFRPEIAAQAKRRGLVLEWGGHLLSFLLPRELFASQGELFRFADGERKADRNFCPSSDAALKLVAEAFGAMAASHPEVSVFHVWPDDLPGGGWCSCPRCTSLSPAAQSLMAARALAKALAAARPEASLAFLSYHDTEDLAAALERSHQGALTGEDRLPANLELLWAPRLRSWGHALGDASSAVNASSLAAFRRAARAWRASGGGRIAVFEYWEDGLLFKGAIPPLASAMAGDLAAYRGGEEAERADAVGILCTGGRLPLAPRPNAALMPALAALPRAEVAQGAGLLLEDWTAAAYGPASGPMLAYQRALESAWALDLDIAEGETAIHNPKELARAASDPPADWGDPWMASVDRLSAKLDRCGELFDHLRAAESALKQAQEEAGEDATARAVARDCEKSMRRAVARDCEKSMRRAVAGEAREYAISGSLLELNCARLSAYRELAAGDFRAAGDIANLALSASAAVKKALRRLPDPRSRRELSFLVTFYYDLRLRAIRRSNARSAVRRLLELWLTSASAGLAALRLRKAYARSIAQGPQRH